MTNDCRPKIGLALGSGGSRGLAHIGVLQVLEENGIAIDYIAGASIGALLGGFYANGMTSKEIEDMASLTNWRTLFSLVDPHLGLGLLGGEKVKSFIESYVDGNSIEKTKIPFAAVATNIQTGEPVVFHKGKLAEAIRASISIPLVFKPTEVDGALLADGGLSMPVPVQVVREMGADIVIAVNLDKHVHGTSPNPSFADIADDSLSILRHHLGLANVASADIAINIDVGRVYWYQFTNGQDIIKTGRTMTEAVIPRLRELIDAKQTPASL